MAREKEKVVELNPVVERVFAIKEEPALGRIYMTPMIYIELGPREKRMLRGVEYDQLTIRDIQLHPSIQQCGILTDLVRYILTIMKCQAVQLEDVQSRVLLSKIQHSKLWQPSSSNIAIGRALRGQSYFRLYDSSQPFQLF